MKYCSHCGAEISEEAVICVKCGCAVENKPQSTKDETLATVIKVFMVLSCIAVGWLIIPLAWCIPMTVSVFKKLNNNEPIGTGLKVCTLLFVGIIPGICLLCMDN